MQGGNDNFGNFKTPKETFITQTPAPSKIRMMQQGLVSEGKRRCEERLQKINQNYDDDDDDN